MNKIRFTLIYILAVVVLIVSARSMVLDARSGKLKDPKSFGTCDEPPYTVEGGQE